MRRILGKAQGYLHLAEFLALSFTIQVLAILDFFMPQI